MKYYRRKRSLSRRRFRPIRKFSRRRRIMRKVMRRRPIIPEVKKREIVSDPEAIIVDTNNAAGTNFGPIVNVGTQADQRIGRQIKVRKMWIKAQIYNSNVAIENVDNPLAGIRPIDRIRVIVWTPRVDVARATTIVHGTTINGVVDFNVCTVHYDRLHVLGQQYWTNVTTGGTRVPLTNQPSGYKYLSIPLKFPRTVNFTRDTPVVTDLEDKDKLIFSIINYSTRQVVYEARVNCFFVDA